MLAGRRRRRHQPHGQDGLRPCGPEKGSRLGGGRRLDHRRRERVAGGFRDGTPRALADLHRQLHHGAPDPCPARRRGRCDEAREGGDFSCHAASARESLTIPRSSVYPTRPGSSRSSAPVPVRSLHAKVREASRTLAEGFEAEYSGIASWTRSPLTVRPQLLAAHLADRHQSNSSRAAKGAAQLGLSEIHACRHTNRQRRARPDT